MVSRPFTARNRLPDRAGLLLALGEGRGMSADLVAAQSDELISVLEQLPEGVFVIDSESLVLFANKPGLRLVKLKPKKTIGQPFPYAVEDGTMRDFDVEMMVKTLSWAGQPATLVHLKPLKSAGAFHLEWKLESALEKARSAELMLEEWKSREGMVAVAAGEVSGEFERSLEETQDQLTAVRQRETELATKLEEYEQLLESQRQEFEDRMAELESLLEMAETRADELQSDLISGDHQAATELQQAVAQARESEEQIQGLELELLEARDRIRVSEEQAEVAEERAYSLEAELSRLEAETEDKLRDAAKPEELLEWQEKLRILQAEFDAATVEREQQADAWTLESAARGSDIEILRTSLAAKDHEVEGWALQLEAKDREFEELQDELQGRIDDLEARASGSEALSVHLDALRVELDEARSALLQKEEGMSALASELEALRQKLETAQDELNVRSEESDELAEQLRIENEHSEEVLEQLRLENEQLQENLREQVEELESLREIASDAESLVEEYGQLKSEQEQAENELERLRAVAEGSEALESRISELEASSEELEHLQKEAHKLRAQLEEAEARAEEGERADKLERKLEGALRRAEEAEERLQEERRLLAELRQTSERRIQDLESRPGGGSAAGGDVVDPETERLAFQDPLTGLPNRNILARYLGFMLKESARYERYTALLRLDCDKFKTISDTFGSEVGDRLIRSIGERLSAVVRGADVLGRLGEDEFVILLSALSDQKEASVVTATVIKRIYQVLKKPFAIDDQNISVGVSIGVSLYPLDASNGEQMFQHSGVALKRAKDTGRGQAQYFTPEVQSSHEARSMLDQELKLGLERAEFGLLYQPIFDLSNGQIVGVEALIRWNHPRLGSIGPDEFLKVAEESGIIVLIGNWALRAALQKAAQWQQQGLGLFVSLNLSRRQLLQADLIPTIQTAMTEFRCPPDRILLEVAEELTGPDLPRLRDTLSNLQQLGVRLAVDNFGTSASSLQELKRGPFMSLKIDRRFVRGVPGHEENAGIVLSALTMGHHLGRITVAVGVETEEERAWLAKAGCRFAQGNLLSAPLPAEHVSEIVARR